MASICNDEWGRFGVTSGHVGLPLTLSDVTELLHSQTRAQWQVAGIVMTLLSTLYLFLFLVVRKADRIISLQEQERGAKEALVRHQAYHDALTGLPNRAYFAERLGETIALAARADQPCALMFVDLDRFKMVNDSLGHAAGDALLKVTSQRIQGCLRKNDLLFRMGGDEFTIILPQLATPEDAAFIARRIQEAVAVSPRRIAANCKGSCSAGPCPPINSSAMCTQRSRPLARNARRPGTTFWGCFNPAEPAGALRTLTVARAWPAFSPPAAQPPARATTRG